MKFLVKPKFVISFLKRGGKTCTQCDRCGRDCGIEW